MPYLSILFLTALFPFFLYEKGLHEIAPMQMECNLKVSVKAMSKMERDHSYKLVQELNYDINETTKSVPKELQNIISKLWLENCQLHFQLKPSDVTLVVEKGMNINVEAPKLKNEAVEKGSYYYIISLLGDEEKKNLPETKQTSPRLNKIENQIAGRSDFVYFLNKEELKTKTEQIVSASSHFIASLAKSDTVSTFFNMHQAKIKTGFIWHCTVWFWKTKSEKQEVIASSTYILETDEKINIVNATPTTFK